MYDLWERGYAPNNNDDDCCIELVFLKELPNNRANDANFQLIQVTNMALR